MTEIIASIENDWAIDSIINAIKMLKGVSSAKMKSVKTDDSNVRTTKKYSQRIERLRQLSGTGITQTDIDNDSRLAYLLNK